MATEKQMNYLSDLITERRADLARATRYAADDSRDAQAVAGVITTRVEMLSGLLATIETGDHANISAEITACQSTHALASYGYRQTKNAEFAKISQRGLPVPPNFK